MSEVSELVLSPSSKRLKMSSGEKVKVAYQGEIMSYTYLAAHSFFKSHCKIQASDSERAVFQSLRSIQDIFESILNGSCAYGVVPLESSSYGTIHSVYDRLLASGGRLMIIGEIGQIQDLCLCVRKEEVSNDIDIERVTSHTHLLDCCSNYLTSLDHRRISHGRSAIERLTAWDSAVACMNVACGAHSDKVTAAICSKEAAALQGLSIIVEAVGNDKNAETRYVVVARVSDQIDVTRLDTIATAPLSQQQSYKGFHMAAILDDPLEMDRDSCYGSSGQSKIGRKCSIAMALRNVPGTIFKMSSCFAFRNIDIVKIESRPASALMQLNILPAEARPFSSRHWDLIFYIDFEPSDQREVNDALFRNLQEHSLWIRVLGAYRAGLQQVVSQPSDWSQMMDAIAC